MIRRKTTHTYTTISRVTIILLNRVGITMHIIVVKKVGIGGTIT